MVRPAHLADFDCSGEEERGRRGRARASDLLTQPGNERGGEDAVVEEVEAGEEEEDVAANVDEEEEVESRGSPRASAQLAAE